jgi:hypothetical protein
MTDVRARRLGPRGAAPLRALYDYAAFYGSMLVFALLCLSWSLLTLPLFALLPRRTAIAWGHYGIMAGFRLYSHWLALLGVYRLDVGALDTLRDAPPLMLAPNHPSLIDAPLILARHPNLTCIMKSDLTGNLLFGPGARLARYVRKGWRFGMRPSLPITYRVRLGRRFAPCADVDSFVAELERYYQSELRAPS